MTSVIDALLELVKVYPQLAWGFAIVLIMGVLYAEVRVIVEKLKPPIVAFTGAIDVFAIALVVVATVFDARVLFFAVVSCILSGLYVTLIYEHFRPKRSSGKLHGGPIRDTHHTETGKNRQNPCWKSHSFDG